MRTCACIIPFYNEGERIFTVLDVLTKIPVISKIVCVDDASSDTTYQEISKRYPHVIVLRNEKNLGKAGTVEHGLQAIKEDFVFLIDADLYNLQKEEFENTITSLLQDDAVDMIIFRRKNDPFLGKLTREEILISGERILKREDLENVFKLKPTKFQIEMAINTYMMDHKKLVFWVNSSSKSVPKIKKVGAKGISADIKMFKSIVDYAGFKKCLYAMMTFCTKEYKIIKKLD